jgi:ketosteroid isomerase-like protein
MLFNFSLAANGESSVKSPKDISAAYASFNEAYATNDVDTYFGFYAEDATVYFYGERQDVAAYREEWQALMDAGGGVEKNETSDLHVQLMPGGDVAIVTYFVDNRTRYLEGMNEERAFETDVWQRTEGAWKIVSLHYSAVPNITD